MVKQCRWNCDLINVFSVLQNCSYSDKGSALWKKFEIFWRYFTLLVLNCNKLKCSVSKPSLWFRDYLLLSFCLNNGIALAMVKAIKTISVSCFLVWNVEQSPRRQADDAMLSLWLKDRAWNLLSVKTLWYLLCTVVIIFYYMLPVNLYSSMIHICFDFHIECLTEEAAKDRRKQEIHGPKNKMIVNHGVYGVGIQEHDVALVAALMNSLLRLQYLEHVACWSGIWKLYK